MNELHCSARKPAIREAFVYHDSMGYRVKMVEVETGGKGGVHDIHHVKEIRSMGNHSEQICRRLCRELGARSNLMPKAKYSPCIKVCTV